MKIHKFEVAAYIASPVIYYMPLTGMSFRETGIIRRDSKSINNSVIPLLRKFTICYAQYEIAQFMMAEACYYLRNKEKMKVVDIARLFNVKIEIASGFIKKYDFMYARNQRVRLKACLTIENRVDAPDDWVKSVDEMLGTFHLLFVDGGAE